MPSLTAASVESSTISSPSESLLLTTRRVSYIQLGLAGLFLLVGFTMVVVDGEILRTRGESLEAIEPLSTRFSIAQYSGSSRGPLDRVAKREMHVGAAIEHNGIEFFLTTELGTTDTGVVLLLPADSEILPQESCPREVDRNARWRGFYRGDPDIPAIEVRIPSLNSCRFNEQGIISWRVPKRWRLIGISERAMPLHYVGYHWNQRSMSKDYNRSTALEPARIKMSVFVLDRRLRLGDSLPPPDSYNGPRSPAWELEAKSNYRFISMVVKSRRWGLVDDFKEPILFLGAGIFFGNIDWGTLIRQSRSSRTGPPNEPAGRRKGAF